MKAKASIQALRFLILIGLFLLFSDGLSLYISVIGTHQQYQELAAAVGRSIFQELVVVRRWNAEHGGVYARVTEKFDPDPYLEDVLRDVTTTNGMKLTKINPEHMTRLISELLENDNGIKVHLTSLKLLNPANRADGWERDAVGNFERGNPEAHAVIGSGASTVFRYMAPLRTEATCLGCHAKQGHKLGDVRGGLSVSFSYVPFQESANRTNRRFYTEHILFFLVGLAIIYLVGKKLILRIVEVQEALLRIKKLEGYLSICSSCKKIRKEGGDPKDQDSWVPFEEYIEDRTEAEFSHGMCPECLKALYGFEYEKK